MNFSQLIEKQRSQVAQAILKDGRIPDNECYELYRMLWPNCSPKRFQDERHPEPYWACEQLDLPTRESLIDFSADSIILEAAEKLQDLAKALRWHGWVEKSEAVSAMAKSISEQSSPLGKNRAIKLTPSGWETTKETP